LVPPLLEARRPPISIVGNNALSKNAQKIPKKNIASLKTNSEKANRIASAMCLVWLPAFLSRIIKLTPPNVNTRLYPMISKKGKTLRSRGNCPYLPSPLLACFFWVEDKKSALPRAPNFIPLRVKFGTHMKASVSGTIGLISAFNPLMY